MIQSLSAEMMSISSRPSANYTYPSIRAQNVLGGVSPDTAESGHNCRKKAQVPYRSFAPSSNFSRLLDDLLWVLTLATP